MSEQQPFTTQRAYTLCLHGSDRSDNTWRDTLWTTHVAVNNGAKAFGDWLLTMRGGVFRTLADMKLSQGKDKPDRDPTEDERRDRRILLALSWLSVESAPMDGDPHASFVVATGNHCQSSRDEKVMCALRTILSQRGMNQAEIDAWKKDCEPSLSAAIREDAVWVSRSAAFDATVRRVGDRIRMIASSIVWRASCTEEKAPYPKLLTSCGSAPNNTSRWRKQNRRWAIFSTNAKGFIRGRTGIIFFSNTSST